MKQSKIGMIGCGMISEVYAKNITERFGDLQLVACADLRMEAAQARAEQFGAKAMTVDELLADPDIDIVLNLTIPDQHAAVSMAALKAGKNVYSEKPLAIHMQDAKELVEYAKAHNLLLGTAPDTFMGGGLQTCRQLLDADTIGTPIAAQAFMMSRGPEAFHPNPKFFYGVEGNNAGAKLVHILGKHGLRRSIAAAGAGNQVGGGLAAGHADQRGGRSVLFKAAALAAGAGQTVAVGDDMPQFRGQPGGAAPALPIDDNAPANAGTQGEQNTCLYILQCTGTHFGQHCRVAIVNDHRG